MQEDIDAAEQELREQKRKHLVYGGAWFAGGLILTIATHSAATEAGGGRYILAWGPMIYGAIRMLRAL